MPFENKLKNAYIGQGIWKPGANTLAYYPFNSINQNNDTSGNNKTLTISGITYGTYAGVDCGYVQGLGYNDTLTSALGEITLNCWFNMQTKSQHYCLLMGLKGGDLNVDTNELFYMGDFDGRPTNGFGLQATVGDNLYSIGNGTPGSIGTWYNGCITRDGSTVKIYLNGVLQNSASFTYQAIRKYLMIGWKANDTKVYMSNIIYEDKAWTAQEIADYYNLTKSNYGL